MSFAADALAQLTEDFQKRWNLDPEWCEVRFSHECLQERFGEVQEFLRDLRPLIETRVSEVGYKSTKPITPGRHHYTIIMTVKADRPELRRHGLPYAGRVLSMATTPEMCAS